MFIRRTPAIAIALLLVFSTHAAAQDAAPAVEIGGGYGAFLVWNKGGDYTIGSTRPAFHVQVTFPFTPRFAFEALATISTSTPAPALHVTNGLYILQVKQRLVSGERFQAFLTYGGAGYYAQLHQSAVTIALPNGATSTINESSFGHTDPPFFAVIGGGFQHSIGPRAAFRADTQMFTLAWLPVGVRVSAGISIPFREDSDSASGVIRR